jgi:hypothetical protein
MMVCGLVGLRWSCMTVVLPSKKSSRGVGVGVMPLGVVDNLTSGELAYRRLSLPMNSGGMKPHSSPPGRTPLMPVVWLPLTAWKTPSLVP